MVTKSREEEAHNIPAVSHMGTARLQTIRREWNPLYSDIVTGFGEATGVPVLLNTSFNLRGEPVVASAADAYRTFISGDLDLLVVGRRVVSATGRTASPTVPPMGSQ
jgi:carbamoyltransferase